MPASCVGVLLLQLGTPDAPTTPAVRRYLRQFLSDRRVVDLARPIWLPILYLGVLTRRPAKSAHLYKMVWTEAGSPLLVTSLAQAKGLADRLATDGSGGPIPVAVGMTYGNPSIPQAVQALTDTGVDRILVFPMFPQYASATTGSSLEALFTHLSTLRVVPSVRVVPPYYADAKYIDALVSVTRCALGAAREPPAQLLLSFHGIPKRYAEEGDPYSQHCRETARLIADAFRPSYANVTMSFQSRFGREEWLQPYTDATLVALGATGTSLAVLCPGFTADCLETIEEIGMTGKRTFLSAGGASFQAVPCLNDAPEWLDAMAAIARRELAGWIATPN